jgi:hypothetical protein
LSVAAFRAGQGVRFGAVSAGYYLEAGGRTVSARDLDELAQVLERAIRGPDPIELIGRAGGDPSTTRSSARKGRISTFAEVQMKDAGGKVSIPDGAIVIKRGQTRWRCLVEVKTAGAPLKPVQVARYLDMVREHDFQAVLTISNEITASAMESPVASIAARCGVSACSICRGGG